MKFTTESIAKLTSQAETSAKKAEAAGAEARDLTARADRLATLEDPQADRVRAEARRYAEAAEKHTADAERLARESRIAQAQYNRDTAAEAVASAGRAAKQAMKAATIAADALDGFRQALRALAAEAPQAGADVVRMTSKGTADEMALNILLGCELRGEPRFSNRTPIQEIEAELRATAESLEAPAIHSLTHKLWIADQALQAAQAL